MISKKQISVFLYNLTIWTLPLPRHTLPTDVVQIGATVVQIANPVWNVVSPEVAGVPVLAEEDALVGVVEVPDVDQVAPGALPGQVTPGRGIHGGFLVARDYVS